MICHSLQQCNTLELAPSRCMLASGGYQNIILYDMNSVSPVVSFESVSKNVTRLGFEEGNRWMFTGGEDCRVRIWDLKAHTTPKRQFELICPAPINSICLHPNQVEVAVAMQNGAVMLWDVKSESHEQLIPDVDASVQDVAISPDGAYLAAVNNRGVCYIWSLKSSPHQSLSVMEPKTKIMAHSKFALRCKFSPDSNYLLTTSADSTAKLWHTSDFSLFREFKIDTQRWIWDAAFTVDSKHLFTASSDGLARLWNVETNSLERQYLGHQKAVTALAFRDGYI